MIVSVVGNAPPQLVYQALDAVHRQYPITGITSDDCPDAYDWFFERVDMVVHGLTPQYIVALPGAVVPDTSMTIYRPY